MDFQPNLHNISRRDFLKLTGSGLLAFLLPSCDKGGDLDVEMFLRKRFGIEIVLGLPKNEPDFSGGIPTDTEARLIRDAVLAATILYPANYFQINNLKRVHIVHDLKIFKVDRAGTAFVNNKNAIGINSMFENKPFEEIIETFHHEMVHIADNQEGGWGDKEEIWNQVHEVEGVKYNPYLNTKYWIGGTDLGRYQIVENAQWFFDYKDARYEPTEDMAAVGAMLMSPARHREAMLKIAMEKNQQTRSILTRKIEMSKNNFWRWSGGIMDEKYWDDLINDRIDTSYWQEKERS